jgi:hypothetical protein
MDEGTRVLTRRFWHIYLREQNRKDRIPSVDHAHAAPPLRNFCHFLHTDFFFEFWFRRDTRQLLLVVMVEFTFMLECQVAPATIESWFPVGPL